MPIREGMNACSEEDLRRKIAKTVERGTGKKKGGTARTFGRASVPSNATSGLREGRAFL
jgi:hypothetical protein